MAYIVIITTLFILELSRMPSLCSVALVIINRKHSMLLLGERGVLSMETQDSDVNKCK